MRKTLGSLLAVAFVVALVRFTRRERTTRRARRRNARDAPPAGARRAGPARPPPEPADVPDEELVARVRQQVAIPVDVEIASQDGAVVLFGRAPRYLVAALLDRVSEVEGVQVVEDRLTPVDLVAPERPPGPPDPTP